jgi:ligand-binding sensor domain-containing protein/signal transduction histidine kinase
VSYTSKPNNPSKQTSLSYFRPMLSHLTRSLALLVTSLLLLVKGADGQPYYFTHYQVEDGLSNNAVMSSLQDHQGFMWFGTRDGLNRFDGLTFKIFRNNPNDPKSIGSNAITSLFEDEHNRIWTGTEKGLFRYDGLTESFQQLRIAGNLSIRNVQVAGSTVWYISLYTLYSYNGETGKLTTYKIPNREITAYCLMKDSSLWLCTAQGTILRYNDANKNYVEYDLFAKSPYSVSKWIESVYYTGTGKFLIGTSNQGLKSFDINKGSYKDLLTYNTDKTEIIVRQILAINANEYWIATQSGIYILNLATGKYLQLSKQLSDPYSLSDNIVHTLSRDKEGGIWAGTYFGGLNYYPKQYITFKKYFPRPSQNSISGNAVREICADNEGNLWIGTEDAGLNKFNTVTRQFTSFTPESNSQSVTYSNIHGLLVYQDQVWAGTYLHGLDILDVKTGKRVKSYTTGNSSLKSNFIYSIFKTRSNQIIVATDKGIYEHLPAKNDFKLIQSIPELFYRTICEDSAGTKWVGSYGDGVFYYNDRTGKNGRFAFEPNNSSSLANNLVNKIFEDSKGTIWIATEGGLCKYEGNNKLFTRYTTSNGFPSNVTYSILEDAKKNLWVTTSKGLVCFTPSTKAIKIYTQSHGLLTDQFNYSSGYKDSTGRMYFGSVKGLITFHPDSILTNSYAAPVFITGFQVYNKELTINEKGSPLTVSITNTKQLTLRYNQSSFSIDFSALSYTAPTMNKYAYILDGLDKSWTSLETNRKVYFTELNPGTYTFRVKAVTDGGRNYGQAAVLTIKILPPVWKSWWAYVLYGLLIITTTYLVIRHFVNRSREKTNRRLERLEYDKEREAYRDKIEFFTNVAHEIRTPLTLIKGPMENIMERTAEVPFIKNNLEIMNRNTERLLHLSNQLLDFRKVEMDGFRLSFSKENITQLLLDQYFNFKPIADQKAITISTDFPENFYASVDLEAFNKIITNLWDNALKYAKSKVEVSLTASESLAGMYHISFRNDGYLIPAEISEKIFTSFYRAQETNKLPGTGIGLTLSRSLAEMHGGTLILNLPDNDMNDFVLTLPINRV